MKLDRFAGLQGEKSLYCSARAVGETYGGILAHDNGKQLLNNCYADEPRRKGQGMASLNTT